MKYEEAVSRWVKNRFKHNASDNVEQVNFESGSSSYGGCPTCGPKYYTYIEVSYTLNGQRQCKRLEDLELPALLKELFSIAETEYQ